MKLFRNSLMFFNGRLFLSKVEKIIKKIFSITALKSLGD